MKIDLIFHTEFILISRNERRNGDLPFEDKLHEAAIALREYVGTMHGPTALAVFGNRIASTEVISKDLGGKYDGIKLTASVPSGMSVGKFEDSIRSFWNAQPSGSDEIYVL